MRQEPRIHVNRTEGGWTVNVDGAAFHTFPGPDATPAVRFAALAARFPVTTLRGPSC